MSAACCEARYHGLSLAVLGGENENRYSPDTIVPEAWHFRSDPELREQGSYRMPFGRLFCTTTNHSMPACFRCSIADISRPEAGSTWQKTGRRPEAAADLATTCSQLLPREEPKQPCRGRICCAFWVLPLGSLVSLNLQS